MLLPTLSAHALNGRWVRIAFATVVVLAGIWAFLGTQHGSAYFDTTHLLPLSRPKVAFQVQGSHPIDYLIRKAELDFKVLLKRQTRQVEDGAEEYRKRRGRQPPPGFDAWYAYAQAHDAIIVEDFFDQIYHDLNPFWGIPAKQIREQASVHDYRISVRNGVVSVRTSDLTEHFWLKEWSHMVESVAFHLPDLDMAINHMDESRIVTPWEEVDGYMKKERESRVIIPANKLKSTFQSDLTELDENPPSVAQVEFATEYPYWPIVVEGCSPSSLARNATVDTEFRGPPPLSDKAPNGSFEGYVLNWTYTQSPCDHPELQNIHGTFVEPVTISTTRTMVPMFGGSKLPMNNDILIPPAMYWSNDQRFSNGGSHGGAWMSKKSKVIWRGTASGGRNREENWRRFQRHRFVSMTNATEITRMLADSQTSSQNFVLPARGASDAFNLALRGPDTTDAEFVEWVDGWSDSAFIDLNCYPFIDPFHCPYTEEYFQVKKTLPMTQQYAHKYLPDIDGNSFSGRYRGFLLSTSLPIKATIYREWHDSRLVPWQHFVPMDNTFIDFYGLMEYFIGSSEKGLAGHDERAEAIALAGQQWAQSVLRPEDMSIYVFRLLLEYARLCDDDRDILGWAENN